MEKIYESEYLKTVWYPTEKHLIQTWTGKEFSAEIFKQELLNYMDLFAELLPAAVLWNNSNFELTILPELQVWVDEKINKTALEYGCLRKIAFVLAPDLFSQVSVEQTMEEVSGSVLTPVYFEDISEAMNWLSAN